MSLIRNLDTLQINETLEGAANKAVPVTAVLRSGESWQNLNSRMLSYSNGYLLISPPWAYNESFPIKFSPGQKLGITFKLKHYKHAASATVKGTELFEFEDGSIMPALKLCCPLKMKRIQRRIYVRADVPTDRHVKITFWQGNTSTEPKDGKDSRPLFTGLAMNISGGGLQINTDMNESILPVKNDPIGLKMFFLPDDEPIITNAITRHVEETNPGNVSIGLQFIGLDQTRQGLADLQAIYGKVMEFNNSKPRHKRRPSISA